MFPLPIIFPLALSLRTSFVLCCRSIAVDRLAADVDRSIYNHDDVLMSKDIFLPPFALHLRYVGAYNPTIETYTVSMMFNISEFRSIHWRNVNIPETSTFMLKYNPPHGFNSQGQSIKEMLISLVLINNTNHTLLSHLPTYEGICRHLNLAYLDGRYPLHQCIMHCAYAARHGYLTFCTITRLASLVDHLKLFRFDRVFGLRLKNEPLFRVQDKFKNVHEASLSRDLYHAKFSLILAYKELRFHHHLRASMAKFDAQVDAVLQEVNAYIPRFETMSQTAFPSRREKRAIISGLITLASTAFSAWKFWRDYRHKQHMRKVLSVILDRQRAHKKGIIDNRRGLLALTQIVSKVHEEHSRSINTLQRQVHKNFAVFQDAMYLSKLESITTRDRLMHFTIEMDRLNSQLIRFNFDLNTVKSMLFTNLRNFVSGLHHLSENKLPEPILHADTLSQILTNVKNTLSNAPTTAYELLFGTSVYPYYHLPIADAFIVDESLYISLHLPLKRPDVRLLSIYELKAYPLPVNMTSNPTASNAMTRLKPRTRYLAFNHDYYANLADDFDTHTLQFGSLFVPRVPVLLHTSRYDNCILNIIDRRQPETILANCDFEYITPESVAPSLIITSGFYYLLNAKHDITFLCKASYKNQKLQARSLIAIRHADLCQCDLTFNKHLIFGHNRNCTPSTKLQIHFAYNYVTEWFNNGQLLKFFYNGRDLVDNPSRESTLPRLPLFNSLNDSHVYNKPTAKSLSLPEFKALHDLAQQGDKIYLSESDKHADTYASRSSSPQSSPDPDEVSLTWIDSDINWELFFFISAILSIAVTLAVIFLCVRYGKVAAATMMHFRPTQAAPVPPSPLPDLLSSCPTISHFYWHFSLFLLILLAIVWSISFLRVLWSFYLRYKSTIHFRTVNTSGTKGPAVQICFEFCSLALIQRVLLCVLQTPSPFLSLHDLTHIPPFKLLGHPLCNPRLSLPVPLSLRHRDCDYLIPLPSLVPLGSWQSYRLGQLLRSPYMFRVIAVENDILTPLSPLFATFTTIGTHQSNRARIDNHPTSDPSSARSHSLPVYPTLPNTDVKAPPAYEDDPSVPPARPPSPTSVPMPPVQWLPACTATAPTSSPPSSDSPTNSSYQTPLTTTTPAPSLHERLAFLYAAP